MPKLQEFGNTVYRSVAKLVASTLGSFDIVQSVFLRRSVAAGEVSFGRSDIDLTAVIRRPLCTPQEAERILALNQRCRLMRTLLPVLGEVEVGTIEELNRSYRADPYRSSLDRRMAVFVYGEPVDLPQVPVTQKDALHWLVIWFSYYLPWALRRGDRRNLRKFALEMWNASATATGRITEPFCRRREVEAAWRRSEGASFPSGLGKEASRTFGECCRIVVRLHNELSRTLEPISGPLVAPLGRSRLVVIPSPGHRLPPEAFAPNALVVTPEVLDLYIQNINPALYAKLPTEIVNLGLRPPAHHHFVDYCRRLCSDPRLLRRPGFVGDRASASYTVRMLARAKQVVTSLRRGEIPQDEPVDAAGGTFERPPTYGEYYRSWYPRLYGDAVEVWRELDALP